MPELVGKATEKKNQLATFVEQAAVAAGTDAKKGTQEGAVALLKDRVVTEPLLSVRRLDQYNIDGH